MRPATALNVKKLLTTKCCQEPEAVLRATRVVKRVTKVTRFTYNKAPTPTLHLMAPLFQ